MNKNNKYYPPLVLIVSLSSITTIIWVAISIYHAYQKQPPPVVPNEMLVPVDLNLNTEIFDEIKQKVYFNEDEINDTLVVTPYEAPIVNTTESTND